jgi:hypothetical protein
LKTSRRTSVALLRAGAVFEKGKLSNAYKTPPIPVGLTHADMGI